MSSREEPKDPRRARRDARRAQILDEAWDLSRRDGLGALSLRDLAARVGLRQPSLYVYFASKLDLYDAMFAQGNQQLLDRVNELPPADGWPDARTALTAFVEVLIRFSAEDPVRHSLLFQRPIPGFEPSPPSYALAETFYSVAVERLRSAGLDAPEDVDMFSALVSGMAHQQVANDPGGDRWVRLAPRAADLLLGDAARRRRASRRAASSSTPPRRRKTSQ